MIFSRLILLWINLLEREKFAFILLINLNFKEILWNLKKNVRVIYKSITYKNKIIAIDTKADKQDNNVEGQRNQNFDNEFEDCLSELKGKNILKGIEVKNL